MMTLVSGMSARDRRALVVGVCIVSTGAMARLVPSGWRWVDDHTAGARAKAIAAARDVQSVRELPRTRVALSSVRSQLARYDSATVDGDAPDAAGAELAELMTTAANAADAQLTSVQLVSARESKDAFGRVAARANLTGDLEALAIFLEGLEAGPQLVAVRTISLTQPDANLPPARRETLRAEVEVEALYRPAPRPVRR